jgi:hypothetical protein
VQRAVLDRRAEPVLPAPEAAQDLQAQAVAQGPVAQEPLQDPPVRDQQNKRQFRFNA